MYACGVADGDSALVIDNQFDKVALNNKCISQSISFKRKLALAYLDSSIYLGGLCTCFFYVDPAGSADQHANECLRTVSYHCHLINALTAHYRCRHFCH